MWRAAKKWLEVKDKIKIQAKWEARSLKDETKEAVLTVREQKDALKDLFLAA